MASCDLEVQFQPYKRCDCLEILGEMGVFCSGLILFQDAKAADLAETTAVSQN